MIVIKIQIMIIYKKKVDVKEKIIIIIKPAQMILVVNLKRRKEIKLKN